jgi:Protein of unknown function (DUF998)
MLTEKHQAQSYPLMTRLLSTCGVVGPLLFVMANLIQDLTRPGYNALVPAASALSLSDLGWMQITNFIVCGMLNLGFAVGVRQVLRGGRSGTWGPILLAFVGVSLIVAGIFVTDPAPGYPPGTPPGPSVHTTLHGVIHAFAGLAFFIGMAVTCFVFTRFFAGKAQWKGWVVGSMIAGVLIIAFFITFTIAGTHNGPAGLFERISFDIGMIGMALFAQRLLSKMRSSVCL